MSVSILTRIVIETLRICAPTLIESVTGQPSRMEVYDRRIEEWSRRLLLAAEIDLRIEGAEHLESDEAFVVMSNHQSHFDIVVLFRVLRRRMRMVAKTELFRVPILAGAMRAAGFVEVDRRNRAQALEALAGATEAIARGTSIWIAPEGTRSETGELGRFKQGGFHLAVDAGARILPVTIDGTRDVLLPHDWRVRRGRHVTVTIGAPIDPREFGKERRTELIQVVRDAILRPLSAPRP